MSFRYFRRYVVGNPQRRTFLPNFWMKLVPNEVEKPSNFVQFIVPLEMNERDVKNYLEKIYKVPVVNVRTVPRNAKITRSPLKGELVKKEDDYRSAFVQLPKDVKFEFPDLFPQEKKQEQEDQLNKTREKGEEIEKEYIEKYRLNKSVPGWFTN